MPRTEILNTVDVMGNNGGIIVTKAPHNYKIEFISNISGTRSGQFYYAPISAGNDDWSEEEWRELAVKIEEKRVPEAYCGSRGRIVD